MLFNYLKIALRNLYRSRLSSTINILGLAIKDHRNIFLRQRMIFSDSSLFQVFDFHLEEGDPGTALTQPKSIVLTREMATRYLGGGTEDALGRTLTVDWNGTVRQSLDVFRDTLKANPRISSVSGSSNVPGSRAFSDTVFKRDDSDDIFSLMFISVGHEFIETYGFRLTYGRGFSREFTKWVIAANLIAWPVAYYAMDRWMQNFAYRTTLGIWPFLLSAVLALAIALLTVSVQSLKAALADPVESLRYE